MTVHSTNVFTTPRFSQPRRVNFLATVSFWMARQKQRRTLATLETDRLNDMGITPEQVQAEAAKMFWQA